MFQIEKVCSNCCYGSFAVRLKAGEQKGLFVNNGSYGNVY